MFLAVVSRPDLAYAVSVVSQYLDRHNLEQWNAVKRILKYLKNTFSYGMEFRSSGCVIQFEGYSDADYARDLDTRRSTTSSVFRFLGGPITWSSQRQKSVSLSTTKPKYVALAAAVKEAMWLRKLIQDLKCSNSSATVLYVGNQLTIQLANVL